MNKTFNTPKIKLAGDSAIIVDIGESIHPEINSKVHNFCSTLENNKPTWIREIIPAYKGLLIYFNPLEIELSDLNLYINENYNKISESATPDNKLIIIPTYYGGEFGPDLDKVINHTNLSKNEVIKTHSSVNYLVYAIGFSPGFPYLGGLPEKLNTPRLKNPRTKIPAGSVAIAETQTGIYPSATPGGWQIIGKTPLKLFDPNRNPPVLLNPGDRIKFEPIKSIKLYKTLEKEISLNKYKFETNEI